MKFRLYPYTVAVLVAVAALTCALNVFGHAPRVELPVKELAELNDVLSRAEEYSRRRESGLTSLRDSLDSAGEMREKWRIAFRLGENWLTFNADSALYYSRLSLAIAEHEGEAGLTMRSRMQEIRSLSSVGLLMWAQPKLTEIDTVGFDRKLMIDYWRTARHFAFSARSYVGDLRPYSQETAGWYSESDAHLLRLFPPGSTYTTFLECEELVADGHYARAHDRLEVLLRTLDRNDNLYGMAAYRLAEVYRLQGDDGNYARYMTLAAISDIMCAAREGWALPALAMFLYEQGDLKDAYSYMNFALREATESRSRMRTLDIAKAVPMIDEAYRHELTSSRDKMVLYLIMSGMFLIVAVGLSVVLWKEIRRGRETARRLALISKRQESYIGNFVDLCASYSSRFDSMTKLVTRKLSSGQADELLKMINSGKFGTDAQEEDFYKTIDTALLDLYPTFVEDVNALLKPECRMELKTPGVLTPELRICAVVRLGVDSGTRIAKILGYSPNTVYAYRNRMKQRAIDPGKFTENLMETGRKLEEI